MVKRIASVLISLMVCTGPAFADWTEGAQYVGLQTGGVFPTSSLEVSPGGQKEKISGTGFAIGGEYLFYAVPQVAFGIDADYLKYGDKSSMGILPNTSATSSSKSILLMGMAKYSLATEGQAVLPYLIGGLGLHVSALKIEAAPVESHGWKDTGTFERRGLVDDNRSSVAAAVGIGADFPATSHTTLGFELRYTYLGSVTYSPSASGRASGLNTVSGAEHLVLLLGKAGFQF